MQLIDYIKDRWYDRNAQVPARYQRLMYTFKEPFGNSRFLLHTTGKLRRFFQVHFRKGYVHRQLLAREGDCRRCGTCCNLLFTCPMLTTRGGCVVYGSCRPQACKAFPIGQSDIREVRYCGSQCGFRFHGE